MNHIPEIKGQTAIWQIVSHQILKAKKQENDHFFCGGAIFARAMSKSTEADFFVSGKLRPNGTFQHRTVASVSLSFIELNDTNVTLESQGNQLSFSQKLPSFRNHQQKHRNRHVQTLGSA